MARIRLNLRNLSVTEKIAKGRHIVTAMTDNGAFSNPNPSLTDVTASLDELARASAGVQAAKSEVATRTVAQDNAETSVNQVLTQLASYVESIAGKDDGIITSAGMETKAERSAPSVPAPPPGLSANAGAHEGEINLTWKSVPNARSYTIEFEHRSRHRNQLDSRWYRDFCEQSHLQSKEWYTLLVPSSGSRRGGPERLE